MDGDALFTDSEMTFVLRGRSEIAEMARRSSRFRPWFEDDVNSFLLASDYANYMFRVSSLTEPLGSGQCNAFFDLLSYFEITREDPPSPQTLNHWSRVYEQDPGPCRNIQVV